MDVVITVAEVETAVYNFTINVDIINVQNPRNKVV